MGLAATVCQKLDLNNDMLNSLYVTGPVGGYVGNSVAAEIRARFGLDALEPLPLGQALAEAGVLSEEEAEYLDDAE